MGILGIYKLALNHKKLGITKEIIASRVLPFLIPLCIENGLTLQQFNALTSLVKEMFQIVENEHRTKLEQLNSVKDEQKVLASTVPVAPISKPVELDKAFTGLGLDNFMSNVSVQEKQNLAQQDSVKSFDNQSLIEPVKIASTSVSQPKELSSSLMDDWTSAPKITSPPSINNSFSNSFAWSRNDNQNITSPSNQDQRFDVNKVSVMSPTAVQNQWGSIVNSPVAGQNNWSNMSQSYSSFQSNSQNFASPNPWTSNQASVTYSRADNSQNWSALDNLLPTNANSNSKVPMNMMSQNEPLIPSPSGKVNNNPSSLSKDDIMDLLS
ncbi:hypothetical protein NQ314_004430 [Rhamnusium bicolor]|uniref:SCY1-like protein 2 n=1 Tax=Rhamnusium bicolor TaxID=1586634 RepID=A0AAV8ZJ20_9CUCU|nr:hypothetical protein NQ314_004430 [Rhamnusium bicolor]